jgi:hypothetical protein
MPRALAASHASNITAAGSAPLCCRSGTERIAGGKHYGQALVLESLRELADGCGLASAVHSDHQDDEGAVLRIDVEGTFDRRQDVDEGMVQPHS